MTDRPIIFSAPMVRALLEGRKTQTRRVLKPQPEYRGDVPTKLVWQLTKGRGIFNFDGDGLRQHAPALINCAIGDRLWVRENWQALSFGDYAPTKSQASDLRYAATDPLADSDKDVRGYPWRPSIHMPRWASRLTLIVTDVRVQRLNQLTDEDAAAEGVRRFGHMWSVEKDNGHGAASNTARGCFRLLWNSLYGPEAWGENPWVAAVSFDVRRGNIDKIEVVA